MFEILKSIRAKLTEYDRRFDELGDLVRKHRRDTAGLIVMAESVTGNFAEELAAIKELASIEKRLRVLEARGS